jgi:hypothetical protein
MLGDIAMIDFDDLVARIGAKARAEGDLPAVATASQVVAAEQSIGFPLPSFLVALYRRIADGGFGPGRAVGIPGYDGAVLYSIGRLVEVYHENSTPDPRTPFTPWPKGVVPMLYWGHFGEAAIDCLDPAAPVLLYESDVDTVTPTDAWKIDQPTIEQWWEAWVDGRLTTPTAPWPGPRNADTDGLQRPSIE